MPSLQLDPRKPRHESTARREIGWSIVIDRPGESPQFVLLDVGATLPSVRIYRNQHEAERTADGLGRNYRVVPIVVDEYSK